MNYAVVQNGIVVNVIVWDGVSPYEIAPDESLVLIPDGSGAWIGWSYNNGTFTPP